MKAGGCVSVLRTHGFPLPRLGAPAAALIIPSVGCELVVSGIEIGQETPSAAAVDSVSPGCQQP